MRILYICKKLAARSAIALLPVSRVLMCTSTSLSRTRARGGHGGGARRLRPLFDWSPLGYHFLGTLATSLATSLSLLLGSTFSAPVWMCGATHAAFLIRRILVIITLRAHPIAVFHVGLCHNAITHRGLALLALFIACKLMIPATRTDPVTRHQSSAAADLHEPFSRLRCATLAAFVIAGILVIATAWAKPISCLNTFATTTFATPMSPTFIHRAPLATRLTPAL